MKPKTFWWTAATGLLLLELVVLGLAVYQCVRGIMHASSDDAMFNLFNVMFLCLVAAIISPIYRACLDKAAPPYPADEDEFV